MAKVRVNGLNPMMSAGIVRELGKPYTIAKIPTPKELKEHEILIKVAVASLCHTDESIRNGTMIQQATQLPGSHEPTGTVVAIGNKVDSNIFKPGTRVAAIGNVAPCGMCKDCTGPTSQLHYCRYHEGFLGISKPGAFAEYCVVDDRFTVVLPDSLSFISAAPLTCAGITAWRGIKVSGAKKEGDTVCIVGSGGGVGTLMIQFCKALGFRTVGLERRDVGIVASQKAGIDAIFDVRNGKDIAMQQVYGATLGNLATTTIVLGDTHDATALGCSVTQEHGILVQIAQPETIEVPSSEIVMRDIQIVGSFLGSPDDWKELVEFVAKHRIRGEIRVFHGLEDLEQVVDAAKDGLYGGKLVVVLDEQAVARDVANGAF